MKFKKRTTSITRRRILSEEAERNKPWLKKFVKGKMKFYSIMISKVLLIAFANLYRYSKRREDENIEIMKDAIKEMDSKESNFEIICKTLKYSKERLVGYFDNERWNAIMKTIDCQ